MLPKSPTLGGHSPHSLNAPPNPSVLSGPGFAALDRIPWLPVALLPTPVHPLDRLRTHMGPGCPRILIKRDDLTGLALGGNKSRKLEYLLAAARAAGADTLITCGAAQSNHALQTAAAGREFGFDVRCVLYGSPATAEILTGNLRLHAMLDTPIRWVSMREGETRREQAVRRGIEEEARAVVAAGGVPYRIPTGGSTGVGALGYVRAVSELMGQLPDEDRSALRRIYFASGSGGTHAGLVVGAALAGWPVACVGVEIEPIPPGPDGVSPFNRAVETIAREAADLVGPGRAITGADIVLDARYTGPAYGVETSEGREAARLLFRTEGILLDPVYTAKAFAAMLGAIGREELAPSDTVMFWHTGGAAGIFA
ncbi:MAG TPA: D-cysteine desulfhydrase family protein [Chthonomonadaceae bacterium]|nr:D-cysteine desulfhydrase family protein [Chthonomonadaceae bacterium]